MLLTIKPPLQPHLYFFLFFSLSVFLIIHIALTITINSISWLVFFKVFVFIYVYVCKGNTCMPYEFKCWQVRNGHQIPCSWSYRWLWLSVPCDCEKLNLGFYARAGRTLTHWALFATPCVFFERGSYSVGQPAWNLWCKLVWSGTHCNLLASTS